MDGTFQKLNDYCKLFGWRGISLAIQSRFGDGSLLVRAKTPFASHPLAFRLHTSDVPIAVQVFLRREYEFQPKKDIHTVVDAGANTGFSALFFAERFVDAEIFALEPERSNYALLCENTALCNKIRPVPYALWNREISLELVDWYGKCGFRTKPPEQEMERRVCGSVQGITIPSLMAKYGVEQIDFLKMDIEGAERTVLSGNPGWLDHVGILAVELHDWLDPECSAVFQEVASRFDICWQQGENQFCARRGWV
ncbi:MAG: FkbM family methyltransferase [Kiritimatiellales bacterium]|nr:FkbM family methyltransferase [Kiritimatiellales bacterium]